MVQTFYLYTYGLDIKDMNHCPLKKGKLSLVNTISIQCSINTTEEKEVNLI